MRLDRLRTTLHLVLLLLLSPLGCKAQDGASSSQGEQARAAGLQIVIASSDLAVGPERFAFGLLDASGELVGGAEVSLRFFRLIDEEAQPTERVDATWYPATLEGAGLYVARVAFDEPGVWGAEIETRLPSGVSQPAQRIRFTVAQISASPAIGEPAPATANRTLEDVDDIAQLTSDPRPDPELYRMTVDEARANGLPTVLVFASPGYCQTSICGPVVEEVKAVKAEWGASINFLHIEVYQDFDTLILADEMAIWGLQTEPWVFVLDAKGHVAAKLEGSVTRAELEPIVEGLAGG